MNQKLKYEHFAYYLYIITATQGKVSEDLYTFNNLPRIENTVKNIIFETYLQLLFSQ